MSNVGIAPLNPDYVVPGTGMSAGDLAQLGYSGSDILTMENDGYTPVVPSSDSLGAAMAAAAGVPFMPAPTSNASDSMGIGNIPTNPNNTPNQTGGWEGLATAILNSAAKGFTAYNNGSPSAGIPAARTTTGRTNTGLLTTATGQTNWAVIGVVILAAGVGIWAVVHYA